MIVRNTQNRQIQDFITNIASCIHSLILKPRTTKEIGKDSKERLKNFTQQNLLSDLYIAENKLSYNHWKDFYLQKLNDW